MTKTDKKAAEKIALSSYARHLYDGLTFRGSYSLDEVVRYWGYAKDDPGGHCPQLSGSDVNVFALLNEYKHNCSLLEAEIARRQANAPVDNAVVDNHAIDAANNAFENECSTKGLDAAAQGAWDNANIYADTYGVTVESFKAALLHEYRGHITR